MPAEASYLVTVHPSDLPLPVCDKTASALRGLAHRDLLVTGSTFHYRGGGCC